MPTNTLRRTAKGRRVVFVVSAMLFAAAGRAPAQEERAWGAESEERVSEQAVDPAVTTPVARAPVRNFAARTSTDRACRTTATTLVPIPGTTVGFTLNGSQPQEVMVTFSAAWPIPRADEIPAGSTASGAFVFLFVDDDRVDAVSLNGGVLVHEGTASSVSNGTHGFTFVTEPLLPGQHTARMFMLDNVLGPFGVPNGTICVGERSTVVQHN
jgi:hypothetical protein